MSQASDLRILVIDDNPAIQQDFIKILMPRTQINELDELDKVLFGGDNLDNKPVIPTFRIDTASQGSEGVERVKEAIAAGEPYALAFVDIRMPPGMDGLETIKEVWKIAPDIQTVICTAYSDYSWEETVEKLGMKDNLLILKKPFDTISVRQLACALTRKWQLLQAINENTKKLEIEVKERTESLQHSLSLTRATLESSADAILVVSKDDKLIDYNNQALAVWKITKKIAKVGNFKIIKDDIAKQLSNSVKFLNKINELSEKAEASETGSIKSKDGRIFEYYTQPHMFRGKTIGRVWSFRDITQRTNLERKLEYQATHDTLTGLANRVLLVDRLQQAILAAERSKSMLGVLFFDLDRFKLVNDSLGHRAGDHLLKLVASRLQKTFRAKDTIARLGGDEFVCVFEDIHSEQEIIHAAHRLLGSFKDPYEVSGREVSVTPSIGISVYPKDGRTVDELLKNSDLAMYSAKSKGANQFQSFTEELSEKALLLLEKEEEFINAIRNNEFFLLYQPQFDLLSNKIISAEALIRWNHPERGVQLPLDFIPFAEETGQIVPLGEWILKTACQQNKNWQEQGFPPIRVAVNVATKQLKQINFVEVVSEILHATGLESKYLEVEVTENVILSNQEVIQTIKELKEIGVQVSLDDFGTGNSSLSYLKKLNIDRLKIDQSFVHNINMERSDEVIIKAIIDMAQSLEYEVLAEGVETEAQLEFLKKTKCESVQGFLYGSPMSSEEIKRFMVEQK